jgi:lambda repressor-like predicted transcriptional regulator
MDFDIERHKTTRLRLKEVGSSLKDIADELGVSPGFVTKVSQGWNVSKRVEAEIAHRLKIDPSEIWPARYKRKEDA